MTSLRNHFTSVCVCVCKAPFNASYEALISINFHALRSIEAKGRERVGKREQTTKNKSRQMENCWKLHTAGHPWETDIYDLRGLGLEDLETARLLYGTREIGVKKKDGPFPQIYSDLRSLITTQIL